MIDRPTIIVAAYSARSLACSAIHAGFAALSIDVFGDGDTREMSFASVKLDGGLSQGLTPDKVACAVETLISAYDPVGLVYGAGFEHQPETIAAIARRTRVFGNDAEVLKRPKDPVALARVCEANGVRHPQVAFAPPDEPELWLMKRKGGAGGAHIAAAAGPGFARLLLSTSRYWSERLGSIPRDRKKSRYHWPQHAMDSANTSIAVSIWRRRRTRRH